jgi:hypothetical protein
VQHRVTPRVKIAQPCWGNAQYKSTSRAKQPSTRAARGKQLRKHALRRSWCSESVSSDEASDEVTMTRSRHRDEKRSRQLMSL